MRQKATALATDPISSQRVKIRAQVLESETKDGEQVTEIHERLRVTRARVKILLSVTVPQHVRKRCVTSPATDVGFTVAALHVSVLAHPILPHLSFLSLNE